MYEYTSLHAARVGERAQRRFGRARIERVQRAQRGVDRGEVRVGSRRAQMFVDRGGVVLNRIAEEQGALRGEIVEPLRARPQQLEHGEEPGVAIAEIVVVP